MSSILTNNSAMSALQTLRSVNEQLDTTQSRISSGKKVAGASDNAAYWSIATTMKSDNNALSTVSDALGLGAATLDTAYNGMNSAIDVVDQIKAKLVAAKEPGVDKGKVQKDITQLQNQLKSIASSSSFNGQNWLQADSTDTSFGSQDIVGSFNRQADGTVAVTNLTVDTSSTLLIDSSTAAAGLLDSETTTTGSGAMTASILTLDITATGVDSTDLDDLISFTDAQYQKMTDAAADLGSAQKRVTMQSDFVSNLMDSIDQGVGRLVDADMNEESTKLKALQTQQQLGIQALSIANSNSQNILSLFR